MKNDRLVLGLEKLKGADQERDVMPVDRAEVTQSEILEEYARQEDLLHAGLDLVSEIAGALAADPLDELGGLVVQVGVGRAGSDSVEIGRDGAGVLGDRPLVIVEDHDQALGRFRDVVKRFVTDTAGEGGIPRNRDNVLASPIHVTRGSHAKGGRERGARVSGPVAVMLAFRPKKESVKTSVLAHGVHLPAASRQDLVDVALMADIKEDLVGGCVEDPVECDRQLNHSQVRPEVPPRLRQRTDEFLADLLRKTRQILFGEFFEIGG